MIMFREIAAIQYTNGKIQTSQTLQKGLIQTVVYSEWLVKGSHYSTEGKIYQEQLFSNLLI